MNSNRRDFALQVVRTLRDAGFQALWAGGCVRDLILGVAPSDYDVATDAVPEAVMRLFRRTIPVGISFGVVRVLGPRDAGEVEVATFRSDGRYLDGRHPESVRFGSPEEDAARRDFTINGMFLDPLTDMIIDHVGGRDDLKHGILRAIGDPVQRFTEDKLRLLRAVRFASRFSFRLDPATEAALRAMADQVTVVAPERITQEWKRLLLHPNRVGGVRLTDETGLLRSVLPELKTLQGVHRPEDAPRDLWEHSLRVLELLPNDGSFPLMLAALLHEVGEGVDERCRALKLSNAERERVVWLIGHQNALVEPRALSEARLKRMLARPEVHDLLALQRAEALATSGDLSAVDFCEAYLLDQPQGPIDPPPLLNGKDLQAHGLRPGPDFSRWLDQIRDAQLDRLIETKGEALAYLDQTILKQS